MSAPTVEEHGPDWTDSLPGEPASCRCGFNGTPEECAAWRVVQARPKPRLRACVERWPDAEEGAYNPACCRWPKSCSATVYDPERLTADDLEVREDEGGEGRG